MSEKQKKTKEKVFDKLTNEERAVMVPYYVHEGAMERLEREVDKWRKYCIYLLVLVGLMIAAFFVYESQYETYSYKSDAQYDSEVATSVINTGTGAINYNGYESQTDDQTESEKGQQEQSNKEMP